MNKEELREILTRVNIKVKINDNYLDVINSELIEVEDDFTAEKAIDKLERTIKMCEALAVRNELVVPKLRDKIEKIKCSGLPYESTEPWYELRVTI